MPVMGYWACQPDRESLFSIVASLLGKMQAQFGSFTAPCYAYRLMTGSDWLSLYSGKVEVRLKPDQGPTSLCWPNIPVLGLHFRWTKARHRDAGFWCYDVCLPRAPPLPPSPLPQHSPHPRHLPGMNVYPQIRRRAADAASRLTGGRFGSGGYGGFSYGGLDMSDEERRRLLLSAPDFLATSSAPGHPGHYHQVGVRLGGRAMAER